MYWQTYISCRVLMNCFLHKKGQKGYYYYRRFHTIDRIEKEKETRHFNKFNISKKLHNNDCVTYIKTVRNRFFFFFFFLKCLRT